MGVERQQHLAAHDAIRVWAESGAMSLTGRPGGPWLGPPAGLVERVGTLGELVRGRSAELGSEVALDVVALLGERAAIGGLARGGAVSCSGASRLLRTRDCWLAVTLARADDRVAVPAWLEVDVDPDDPWPRVAEVVADRPGAELVARAALLSLPVAALPPSPSSDSDRSPVAARGDHRRTGGSRRKGGHPGRLVTDLQVLDLSSLWAGPLCTQVLLSAGAVVTKVESRARPDGARSGPAAFFDLLNAGKRSVVLDVRHDDGRRQLEALIERADVVVESSRPRALQQLGIDAAAILAAGSGPAVWVSITGYGRGDPGGQRVAFGDDAAVAGGLVAWDDDGPCFCADAIADPLSGVVAAAECFAALRDGEPRLVDIAMADVASRFAGPTIPLSGSDEIDVAPARARPTRGRGPALGQDNGAVLG